MFTKYDVLVSVIEQEVDENLDDEEVIEEFISQGTDAAFRDICIHPLERVRHLPYAKVSTMSESLLKTLLHLSRSGNVFCFQRGTRTASQNWYRLHNSMSLEQRVPSYTHKILSLSYQRLLPSLRPMHWTPSRRN